MCAWKYPQEWFKDGDIIEPSDWRLNHQEYLGEVNGQLDNDNFYKKLFTVNQFRQGTFNTFYRSSGVGRVYNTFEHTSGGWMHTDDSEIAEELPSVVINATEDGLVIVDANINQFWLNYDRDDDATPHHVWYSYWRPNGVRSQAKSAYVLCGMYRITCNGLSICETGPIGNEYRSQPIYLCGSIPISAGQNKVQIEARYVWYSPGRDKYVESSAKNPVNATSKTDDENEQFNRQDVEINSRLIVNHRKR